MSSCGHKLEEFTVPLLKCAVTLTKNDLFKIRTGRFRVAHFHGSNINNNRVTIFFTRIENPMSIKDKSVITACTLGECVNIKLTKDQLRLLSDGKDVLSILELEKEQIPIRMTLGEKTSYIEVGENHHA